jgi:hypothetical protein
MVSTKVGSITADNVPGVKVIHAPSMSMTAAAADRGTAFGGVI